MKITNWKQFARQVRSRGTLLSNLSDFEDPILISGCQRSGGTMLAHALSRHTEMVEFDWFRDAELHAGLILSGVERDVPAGRWVFQTTYLNECYPEYFEQEKAFKLVWLGRNPYSVVYSMVSNWSRFALNELFDACGSGQLTGVYRDRYERWGRMGVRMVTRACAAYVAKVEQMAELRARLSEDAMHIIEYERLVQNKESELARICEFVGLGHDPDIAGSINTNSLHKASRLSRAERHQTAELCGAAFDQARALARG